MLIEGLCLRHGRRAPWVLRDVDLSLGAAETAVLTGPNGAGKSTLLQAVVGVLRPARGRIADRPEPVGWVPERFPADQPFTVRAYLTAMGAVRGLGRATAAAAVGSWAERLHLTGHLDVRLPALSKGTAQKVGLAQAMLAGPRLLVLDEPTEGLDATVLADLPGIIAEVTAAGGSVLVSDHSGSIPTLAGAQRWRVGAGRVTVEPGAGVDGRRVIEVSVAASRVETTVARLRAEGHDILGVRREP